MRHVGIFEAKTHLSQLLDAVEAGEEIVVTRRGKPIAHIVPAPDDRREKAKEAVARIRALRKGLTLDGVTVKELIEDGRT
ncbi:type II toxin-antitoxin system prevent-host-death family antitoxin [Thalassobaculum sp. OXR-137]|uniref:type II toxin-antitoxin system Phd/YefM family antitoxin n=1 Tax=Thalassobaculum sp. OXR-137 TaxID=3100173 RepID=UPI002AC97A53|nr:type II toxin-antitoxin system prevent-host-death family antitoxin [Thalassobaculum sp. OXR-137]WPZ33711.1 type II toxin-antitoxin system prevent-host-death family antitoxin [Thalassobaculum sp. OXR-137]